MTNLIVFTVRDLAMHKKVNQVHVPRFPITSQIHFKK